MKSQTELNKIIAELQTIVKSFDSCIDTERDEQMFIVKQISTKLKSKRIPTIQSLSQSAKTILLKNVKPLTYNNQIVVIDSEGNATSWIPETEDLFATDWVILEY